MKNFRWKLAAMLEYLVHWLRYSSWHHVADWELVFEPEVKKQEIVEDFFGDVYVLHHCRYCRLPFFGEHLGNSLLETVDGEVVYTGVFKADRLDRFIEQGYALVES